MLGEMWNIQTKKIKLLPELEPEPPGPSVIICSCKKMNTSFAFVALQIFIKKRKKIHCANYSNLY